MNKLIVMSLILVYDVRISSPPPTIDGCALTSITSACFRYISSSLWGCMREREYHLDLIIGSKTLPKFPLAVCLDMLNAILSCFDGIECSDFMRRFIDRIPKSPNTELSVLSTFGANHLYVWVNSIVVGLLCDNCIADLKRQLFYIIIFSGALVHKANSLLGTQSSSNSSLEGGCTCTTLGSEESSDDVSIQLMYE